MINNTKQQYCSPKQARFPLFIADTLDICDPVLAFDRIMEEIGIEQYQARGSACHRTAWIQSCQHAKTILFGFMDYICETDTVDLQHIYIDGSKFEADANKYTWVWKKATEKSRQFGISFSEPETHTLFAGIIQYYRNVSQDAVQPYHIIDNVLDRDFFLQLRAGR